MSIGERNPFSANDYGGGVSGEAKHGLDLYKPFVPGEVHGSASHLTGMQQTDPNAVGKGLKPWLSFNGDSARPN